METNGGQTFKGVREQFVFVLQYEVSDSLGYEQFNVCIALTRERKKRDMCQEVEISLSLRKAYTKLPVL